MTDWIEDHFGLFIVVFAIVAFLATPWVMHWIIEYNHYVTDILND
jgi:hypothetical protein